MIAHRRKLLIVDPSLRDLNGHFFEYDFAIGRAATKMGVSVMVGAHQASDKVLRMPGILVRPWFSTVRTEGDHVRLIRAVRLIVRRLPQPLQSAIGNMWQTTKRTVTGAGFGAEVLQLIEGQHLGAADDVFVHEIAIPEITSLIDALAASVSALPTFHIVLPFGPIQEFQTLAPFGELATSFRRVGTSRLSQLIRFYTDTDESAEQFRKISSVIPISVAMIPHCLPDPLPEPMPSSANPPIIAYLGNARREKGYHLLPDAIRAIADRLLQKSLVRFIIQSNDPIRGQEPGIAEARSKLNAFSPTQVEIIERQLSTDEFHSLLASASVILLPYDPIRYRTRSSGILIKALAVGRPVIVPTGTWLAQQVPDGAGIKYNHPEGLAAALETVVQELQSLRVAAMATAASFRARHNPEILLEQIMARR